MQILFPVQTCMPDKEKLNVSCLVIFLVQTENIKNLVSMFRYNYYSVSTDISDFVKT